MSSVLQIPEHIRQDSAHQVELIRRMAPGLLAYPINPKDSFIRRIPNRYAAAAASCGRQLHKSHSEVP